VLLSVHTPLALKGRAAPGARIELGLLAETEIELRVAELTVKDVLPVALAPAKLNKAVTLVVPCLIPSMMPMLLPGVPKFATVGVAALHVTEVLISWVEESLKVPVAENCWCQPIGMVWLTGVTVTD